MRKAPFKFVLHWLLLVSAGSIQAQGSIWQTELPDEMKWSVLSPAGTLVVGGDNYLAHVHTGTGALLWTRDDMQNLAPFNVRFAGSVPYMIVSQLVSKVPPKNQLQVVDLETGETVWDTGAKLGANLGVYPLVGRGQVIFLREVTGEKGLENGTYVSAVDTSSGTALWNTRLGRNGTLPVHPIDDNGFISGTDLSGHPEPVVIDQAIIIVAGDLRSISLEDGKLNWHYKLKAGVPHLKRTYAQPVLADGVLYAAGSNRVVALDPKTGSEIWVTKLAKAPIPELHVASDRIIGRYGGTFSTGKKLVQQKPFGAFAIDRATGKLAWEWKRAKDSITNLAVFPEADKVVLADKYRLHVLSMNANKATELYDTKLEFKRSLGAADVASKGIGAVGGFLGGGLAGAARGGLGGGGDRSDPPLDITRVGEAVVVRGQYHVLAHDAGDRANTWSIEFAPPGVSPFSLIAMGAVTTTVAVGNASQAWSASSPSTAQTFVDSTVATSNAFQSETAKRFAASEKSQELAFFLTKDEAGLALIGIDLSNGADVGRVPMSEKKPNFMVDAVGRRIYHFEGDRRVVAHEF